MTAELLSGSGIAILPGRFNGGLCVPLQEKTRGNQSSSGADSAPLNSAPLSKLSSPLGRTRTKKNEEIFATLASKSPLKANHKGGIETTVRL